MNAIWKCPSVKTRVITEVAISGSVCEKKKKNILREQALKICIVQIDNVL